jgi:hypothetical protein
MNARHGQHWFAGASVSALQTSRTPVHRDVGIVAPNGRTCAVDHVHFASRTDAVLEPCAAAPSVVNDAAVVLGELVSMSLQWAQHAVRVSVDADGTVVAVRVTTPPPATHTVPQAATWARSLNIVQSLSTSWDYRIDESGAQMSAEIRTPDTAA